MSTENRGSGIRRILVALDAATHTPGSLETVAELAARLRAEVSGLFVEDEDLIRTAGLPCVRQVGLPPATAVVMNRSGLQRDLKNLASAARRDLERAAARARVKWSFRVVRGRVAAAVSAAAEDADLVVVESASRPLGRHLRLGAPARTAAERTRRPVLFLQPGRWLQRPAVAVVDGTAGAEAALEMAASLAAGSRGDLRVVLAAGRLADIDRLQQHVDERLSSRRLRVRTYQLPAPSTEGLCAVARQIGSGVLVAALESPLLGDERARELLRGLDCPVMLVR